MTLRPIIRLLTATVTVLLATTLQNAQAQTAVVPGNLVVLQVGGTTLNNAAAVALKEYTTATGQATPVQTITIASTGASALTLTGNSTTQGILNLSANNQLITFGGYRKDAGGTNPQSDASATTNRVIGVLNLATGTVNTAQALTDGFSADSFRSVVTNNGTSFYAAGAGNSATGGIRYVASTSATTSTPINNGATGNPNTRQVQIVNGTLFVASSFNVLATPDSGTAFRGVVFSPVPEPATVLGLAGLALAAGRGVRRLRARA